MAVAYDVRSSAIYGGEQSRDQGTAIIYENYILSDLRKQYMATTGKKALYYLSMLTLQPQRRQTGSDQQIISLFRRFVK